MRTTLLFVIFLVLTLLLCTGVASAQEPDTLWTHAYGESQWDDGYSVTATSDGGFAFVGSTASFGVGGYDVYLVKVDADGDTLWTRAFGGSGEDKGRGIDETSDHGLIAVGCTKSFGDIGGDVYMIRTNATGDTLWTKVLDEGVSDGAWDVKQTTDGGYAVVGYANDPYYNRTDLYFLKTDGDTLWTKTCGVPSHDDIGRCVMEIAEDEYIISGEAEYTGPDTNWDAYL